MNTDEALYYEVQELREELKQRDQTIEQLKNAMKQGNELYANLRFDDEPFTPYQLALQKIEQLKKALKELIRFAFEVRNSTNLNQEGRQKVLKINSIIERVEKLLR